MMARKPALNILRPMPPPALLESDLCRLVPAPEVAAWFREQILQDTGAIHNPDHLHLQDADIQYLWASEGFTKQQRTVIGQAEQVMFTGGGWKRARQEQQFKEWFGHVPDYLITLDASYCASCGDAEFCALVEHEHFHIAQKVDDFGAPAFDKDGFPKLGIRGHDVEEFVGVVERYGAGAHDSAVNRMARAANAQPLVSRASIAASCGTCLRLVA